MMRGARCAGCSMTSAVADRCVCYVFGSVIRFSWSRGSQSGGGFIPVLDHGISELIQC